MKALIISTILTLTALPAIAQQCAPREAAVRILSDEHGEVRISRALDTRQRMIEIYANPETGSWTALMSAPHGSGVVSCIVSSGTAFELVEDEGGAGA